MSCLLVFRCILHMLQPHEIFICRLTAHISICLIEVCECGDCNFWRLIRLVYWYDVHHFCWLRRLAHGRWRVEAWSLWGWAWCLSDGWISKASTGFHHVHAHFPLMISTLNWVCILTELDGLDFEPSRARINQLKVLLIDWWKFAVPVITIALVWIKGLIRGFRWKGGTIIHNEPCAILIIVRIFYNLT